MCAFVHDNPARLTDTESRLLVDRRWIHCRWCLRCNARSTCLRGATQSPARLGVLQAVGRADDLRVSAGATCGQVRGRLGGSLPSPAAAHRCGRGVCSATRLHPATRGDGQPAFGQHASRRARTAGFPHASESVWAFVVLVAAQALDAVYPLYDVNALTLRQTIPPQPLPRRANAMTHVIARGAIPFGALAGSACRPPTRSRSEDGRCH